jgi:hypothetical protein
MPPTWPLRPFPSFDCACSNIGSCYGCSLYGLLSSEHLHPTHPLRCVGTNPFELQSRGVSISRKGFSRAAGGGTTGSSNHILRNQTEETTTAPVDAFHVIYGIPMTPITNPGAVPAETDFAKKLGDMAEAGAKEDPAWLAEQNLRMDQCLGT